MHVLQSNRESEFLSCAKFIDFRFDLSVAIFPLSTSYILEKKSCLVGLTVCLCTDRLLLWFSASETGKSSNTNYRRHTQSITGPELSSDSIQLSTNQNRSNAATQSNAKKKKPVHLAMRNNLFLSSLLLQSVTSHFPLWIIDQSISDKINDIHTFTLEGYI